MERGPLYLGRGGEVSSVERETRGIRRRWGRAGWGGGWGVVRGFDGVKVELKEAGEVVTAKAGEVNEDMSGMVPFRSGGRLRGGLRRVKRCGGEGLDGDGEGMEIVVLEQETDLKGYGRGNDFVGGSGIGQLR